MAFSIVRVASGGIPVVESPTGLPYYEDANRIGIPVTFGSTGIALGGALPPNFMPFSEDPTKFTALTGGTGSAIERVFSSGATIVVGTKQQLPDIPSGEVGTGFTCTGMVQDPDSTDVFIGNFGNSRGGAGSTQTPISIVRVSSTGATYVGQILATEAVGGLQGVAFVTAGALRCLAYADGASSKIYFVNTNGTIPRAAISTSFAVNGLAWDDVRQGFWASDAASGDVWFITLAGQVTAYADFNNWGGPVDHIVVDTSRGTGSYLWVTAGANGSPGVLVAWDIAKDMIVQRYQLDSAKAVEGIMVSGTTLKVVTDGYYHSTGTAPNTAAPYNVNEFQVYTIPTVTQWRYSRVWKAGELAGPYGRQPYHLLADRGDGDTSSDFFFWKRTSDVPAGSANVAWSGKSFDPLGTANMLMRLLGGTAVNFTFGASYVRRSTAATATAVADDTQLGTRGTQSPDRVVNVVGSALAVNIGAVAVPYKPRLGA